MRKLFILMIRAYQIVLSPVFGQHCRYTPTCSTYAIEAIQQHGAIKGSWLAAKRLVSCNPWHEGGYDPVPGTEHLHPEHSQQGKNVKESHKHHHKH